MEQRYELRMETWPIVYFPENSGKAKVFDNDPALSYTNAPSFDHLLLQLLQEPVAKLHPVTAIPDPPTYFMRDAVIYEAGKQTPLVTLRSLDADGKTVTDPLVYKGNVHYEIVGDFSYASHEVKSFLSPHLVKGKEDTIYLGSFNSGKQKIEPAGTDIQNTAATLRNEMLAKGDYFDFMKREHYDGSTTLFPDGVNVDTLYRTAGVIPALREMLTERISSTGEFKFPPKDIDLMQTLVIKPDNENVCIYMHLQESRSAGGPVKEPGLYFMYPDPKAMVAFLAKNPSLDGLIKNPNLPTIIAATDTADYRDAKATNEVKHFLKESAAQREKLRPTAKTVKEIKPPVKSKGPHQ